MSPVLALLWTAVDGRLRRRRMRERRQDLDAFREFLPEALDSVPMIREDRER